MRSAGWIAVIESGEHWTAAMRVALRRMKVEHPPRLVRRDSLDPKELDRATPVFLAIEVVTESLPNSLGWLHATQAAPFATTAALISRDAAYQEADRRELEFALLEAGACLVIDSPRDAQRVAVTALRWLGLASRSAVRQQSLLRQAIDGLPWQAAPAGLR